MPVLFGLAVEAAIVIMIVLGIGQIVDRADHNTIQSQEIR
jgi:hypothetical protein